MKRVLLTVICLFLLTGCNVNYNLDISDSKYVEDVSATESYENSKYNIDTINFCYKNYEIYASKPIPLSKTAAMESEINIKDDNIVYYKTTNLSDEDNFGLNFKGTFNKNIPITDSNLISYGAGVVNFQKTEDLISIFVPANLKVFRQFETLDSLNINISTDLKVKYSNADKVKNKIYTWNLNRDNYKNKTIRIDLYKTKSLKEKGDSFLDKIVNKEIIVLCLLIVVFGVLLYFNVKKKSEKNNKI